MAVADGVRWIKGIAEDDSHGYDQTHRNGPDYDCSSLVLTAVKEMGYGVNVHGYTLSMRQMLLNCGWSLCSAPFRAGDVHLSEKKRHCCMSVDDKNIVEATSNELGKATGGKSGDQTGREIRIAPYYDKPWEFHLRAPVQAEQGINEYYLKLTVPFYAAVAIKNLNIRKGAGTDTPKVRYIKPGVYTIVEVRAGAGSLRGWGKLKSGAGWISLDYCKLRQSLRG